MRRLVPYLIYLLISLLLLVGATSTMRAQDATYASQITFEDHVDNATNAVGNTPDFATLNSYGGIAIGIGQFSGELELAFPEEIPANTTTYVRIDFDSDVLNALLGGSLGDLLADILGTVVLGDHYFDVEARDGSTTVLSRTSTLPLNDGRFRIVQDGQQNFYIAITPDQPYDRIYIEDNTDALLLGTTNSMNVYNAFYYSDNQCAINPLYTDFDGSGITLDLLNIGGAGVTNPHHVIDNDTTNFSEISLGVVGVAASIEQNVYFANQYQPSDSLEIKLSTNPTLVNLGLLNNVEVIAYDGTDEVFSESIQTFLTADLLTLLQNGETATIPIGPNTVFDRVTVRLSSLLSVNIAQSLDLYEITVMAPPAPTTENDSQIFCEVNDPSVEDLQTNETNVLWYPTEGAVTPLDPTDPLVDGETYYATQIIDGCESSARLAVSVTINDTPTPTTTETDQTFCAVDEPTVEDLQADGPNIVWYDMAEGGTAYDTTDALVNGQTYYAAATNTTGCESSTRLEVTVTINDTPTPTTTETDQNFCAVYEPTVADLEADGPNITWYDMAEAGTPYDPTDALVNGQTYYATATGSSGCESSERLAVNVTIDDTPMPTTTDTDQTFCAVEEPTVAVLEADGPNITWYDMAEGGTAYDPTDALVSGQTYYAAATNTSGCESSTRLEVTVSINDTPTPTTSNTNQTFCAVDEPTVADLEADGPNITWYDMAEGGTPYDPTDALVSGQTYYAAATNTTGCESSVRLEVMVTINDTPTPTTTETGQTFCAVDEPTVADLQADGPNITWYDMAEAGTPYDPTDALVDGQTYYATATGASGCESSERLAVNVTIDDTPTPTTSNTNQTFCAVDEPTVADLQADGPNITWYDMAEGGTAYDPTDALVDGQTYYATTTGASGCESSERLAVNVTIDDTPTPTTSDTNQTFCAVEEPTVADLEADGPNITWYDMAEAGTPYDPTDALVNGQTYYATATGSSGCESSERLAVSVTINDTPAPTTDNETQVFCTTENPTIADLQADGDTLIWYDMPEDGTPYAATDPLVDGETYYATATDASGCESSERLAVTVEINEGSSPTITSNASGETCLETSITYSTEEGNANYLWSVTGGLVTDGGGASDAFITVQWISMENTSVSVSYAPINDCNTGEEVTFVETVVVCADIIISKTVNDESPMIGDEVQYMISVTNEGPNDFQMLEISENIPSGLALINFNTTLGTYNPNTGAWMIDLLPASQTATLTITVEVLGSGDYTNIASIVSSDPLDEDSGNNSSEVTLTPQCLTVYNEFSPNSDGINDQFTITCIENYPNNELKVFNRYGSLVYRKQGYENDWEGISNVDSGQDSDGLPSGTYYYVLELDRNAEPKSGWIYLMK